MRRRVTAVLLLITLTAIMGISGCREENPVDEKRSLKLSSALKRLLNDQTQIRPIKVRLRDLTDFTWDALYVFGEYTDGRMVRLRTGHRILDDDELFYLQQDMFVFTDGPKLAAVLSSYQFASNGMGEKYSNNVMAIADDGDELLTLQEPKKPKKPHD